MWRRGGGGRTARILPSFRCELRAFWQVYAVRLNRKFAQPTSHTGKLIKLLDKCAVDVVVVKQPKLFQHQRICCGLFEFCLLYMQCLCGVFGTGHIILLTTLILMQ